jgi:hypothetical protein
MEADRQIVATGAYFPPPPRKRTVGLGNPLPNI